MSLSQKINKEIERASRILVASHQNPEGDAIGSALALYHHWKDEKEIQVFNEDKAPYFLCFLPGAELIKHRLRELKRNFDLVVVVDCANLSRVSEKFSEFIKGRKIINIDHHQTNSNFGMLNLVSAQASSTGEIIFELLKKSGKRLNPETATCLYTAISMDTGSFQYINTSYNSFKTATELVKLGAQPNQIAKAVYHSHPPARLLLLCQVLATLEFSKNQKRADITLSQDMYKKAQASPEMAEGFINYLTSIKGIEVAILFRQVEKNQYKVTFRSMGKVNVARLAEELGGGGHHQASGATLNGSLEQIKRQIRVRVDNLIQKI